MFLITIIISGIFTAEHSQRKDLMNIFQKLCKSNSGNIEGFLTHLKSLNGNLIEIGCGNGISTCKIYNLASNPTEKVIAIDPFETAWDSIPDSYGKPYPFKIFKNNTLKLFKNNNIILFKNKSTDPHIPKKLHDLKPIKFSFLDGIQTVDNLLYELHMMDELKVKMICMDDYNRETSLSQVPRACHKFIHQTQNYKFFSTTKIDDSRTAVILERKEQ